MRLETASKMCINKLFSTSFIRTSSSSCRSGPCKIRIYFSKDGKFLVQTPKRLLHHYRTSTTTTTNSRSCYCCTLPIQQCKTYSTLCDGQTRQLHQNDKGALILRDPMDMNRVISEAREFLDSQGFPISSPASTSTLQSLFSNQATVIQSCMDKLIGCPHPIVNLAKDFYRDRNLSYSENQWASIEMSNLRSDCQNSTATQGTYPSLSSFFSISVQLRAILVLLVSKSIDFPKYSSVPPLTSNQLEAQPIKSQPFDNSISSNESRRTIESKQKSLSEITEIMYTAFTLHETIVDIPKLSQIHSNKHKNNPKEDEEIIANGTRQLATLHHGNNLAALMGDLLLAKSSRGLASLRNTKVTEYMSESISDFAESQILLLEVLPSPLSNFKRQRSESVSQISNNNRSINSLTRLQIERDQSNRKLNNYINNEKNYTNASGTDINREIWFRKTQLGVGSLLGHACYCCSLFSGHDEGVRHLAYRLGEKLGLFLQACKEVSFFTQRVNIEEIGNWETTEKSKLRFEGLEFKIDPFSTIPLQFDLCSLPIINALEAGTISKDRIDELRKNFFHGYPQIFKEIQAVQRNEEDFVRLREILNNLEEDVVKLVQQIQSISSQQSTTVSNKAPKLLIDLIHSMRPL